MKNLGKALQKWHMGLELHDAPGLTLMCRHLLTWTVITCKAVWKEVCPSIAVSVIKQVSMLDMGFTVVKWLTCCEVLFVVLSWFRHLLISLGLLVASISLFVLLQWCLWLLESVGGVFHFCNGGDLVLLGFVLDVVEWTLIQ